MSKATGHTRGQLRDIGQRSLVEVLARYPVRELTIEQAIGVGIAAALLLIQEDISRLVGMYNTVTMAEKP